MIVWSEVLETTFFGCEGGVYLQNFVQDQVSYFHGNTERVNETFVCDEILTILLIYIFILPHCLRQAQSALHIYIKTRITEAGLKRVHCVPPSCSQSCEEVMQSK